MLRRLATVLTAMSLVLTALAPSATAEDVFVLGGTNVISTSTTTRVTVSLEHDAVLDLSPAAPDGSGLPRALGVEGGRGFVGFALTEPLSTSGLVVVALQTPELGPDGAGYVAYGQPADAEPATLPFDEAPSCVRCVVPAGEYHLFLVTGGGATTVTLTLEGLHGRSDFQAPADSLFTSQIFGPEKNWFESAGGPIAGGGIWQWFKVSTESPEPGLLIHAFRATASDGGPLPTLAWTTTCQDADGDARCADDVASETPVAVNGFAVVPALMAEDGVATSIDFTVTDAGQFTVGQDMLWLPLDDFIPTLGGGAEQETAGSAPQADLRTWRR